MSVTDEADLTRAVLEMVQEASAQTSLIALDEILKRLRAHGFAACLDAQPEVDPCLRVAAVMSKLPNITTFVSRSGRTLCHDQTLLSHTYARFLDNKDAVEVLLAEEIRANSRDYPRPVPVELFEKPPFDLAPETIEAALKAMAANPKFPDITSITTSMGTTYLFSSLYLEHNHATFLAQQDASFAMNP
ncbi:hypothetical protein DFW101_0351 [Solidesulfovibrio carbinoliphilus subsp. oakridgensis]|uniref:Uncharacterized protein n=1 Tax=Solidesulfovibrio carbinoliphilus subsp. oakridgensis TaxID=694327 RepID=G7QD62_9BACT|nr:hypothetical protein [Solidesulfovibrio carbinoliphilus]EHJ46368.1 hypothetical protein DFW101_0351 [Solidesulfovibrio carbinoliphilus subsp. oakridgensis]